MRMYDEMILCSSECGSSSDGAQLLRGTRIYNFVDRREGSAYFKGWTMYFILQGTLFSPLKWVGLAS